MKIISYQTVEPKLSRLQIDSLNRLPWINRSRHNDKSAKSIVLIGGGLYKTVLGLVLPTLVKQSFESIAGKGENAGYQHFLLFQQCFLLHQGQIALFKSCCRLHMLLIWTGLKFVVW